MSSIALIPFSSRTVKMPRYGLIIFIVLGFFFLVPHDGLADETLTWQDCVKEALAHHPDLVSAKAKWDQAKASRAITRSVLLPQITSSAGGSTSKNSHASRTDSYSYGVTGKQLLFDGFKASDDVAAAQKNIEASHYAYEVTSSNVQLSLRTAFVDLLNSQELLKVTRDIAKSRQQNLDMINLLYQEGREHRGSLLTAQADLAQALFEVEQAKRGIDLAQRKLSKELGREHFFSMNAQEDLTIPKIDPQPPQFETLAEENPFLRELISQKESAKFGLKSAKADFFPKIYANAGAGKDDSSWPPKQTNWSAGLSLTFPLFEGGIKQAQVSKANALLTQVQADERSGRDGVVLTLVQVWTQLQDAAGFVSVQEKFLEAAQERAKIAESEYANGLVSFNDWTVIEGNLVFAKKAFLAARTNALITQANWVQAKGGLLDE